MKSETRRLNRLKDTSRNLAKRYKLPEGALKIIEKYGKVHGQQSRAIQVAVELLWEKVGWRVPDRAMSAILDSPLTGKTYKLPPRTISFIESLAHEYGTQGRVLAAVAYMLSKPNPRGRTHSRAGTDTVEEHGRKDSGDPPRRGRVLGRLHTGNL